MAFSPTCEGCHAPAVPRQRPLVRVAAHAWRGAGAALAGPLLLAACSWFEAMQPPPPAPASQPALPAYVYPSDPPLVGAEELRGLLVRLDARKTLIWVFDDSPSCPDVAALLADYRDGLRVQNIAIVGLFTGPPLEWQTRAVPMLRAADANFPCAVLDPARRSAVGVWLGEYPAEPPAGAYVLAQTRRVVLRTGEDESSIRDCLDGLTGDVRLATRPAWTSTSSRPETLGNVRRAEVRLIEIASGRTLAQAEGRAEAPERLAKLLAEQLAGAVPEPPRAAILPLRQSARSQESSPGLGLAVAEHLGRYLVAAGWPHLVQAHEADAVLISLDQTPLGVEFNPAPLQGQTPWQAVLVGTAWPETVSGPP